MNSSFPRRIITVICFILLLPLAFGKPDKISKTKLYDINGNKYISSLEYANAQNIRTIFYEDKEKLEFRVQNFKLLISPHSSFIRVNENIYHMYLPVVYDGNDFYIPVVPFLEILHKTKLCKIVLQALYNVPSR